MQGKREKDDGEGKGGRGLGKEQQAMLTRVSDRLSLVRCLSSSELNEHFLQQGVCLVNSVGK